MVTFKRNIFGQFTQFTPNFECECESNRMLNYELQSSVNRRTSQFSSIGPMKGTVKCEMV